MKKKQESITLSEAARRLGRDRKLVRYLVRDRLIPCVYVGASKVIDADGFRLLERALAEHEAKPEPAVPFPSCQAG